MDNRATREFEFCAKIFICLLLVRKLKSAEALTNNKSATHHLLVIFLARKLMRDRPIVPK